MIRWWKQRKTKKKTPKKLEETGGKEGRWEKELRLEGPQGTAGMLAAADVCGGDRAAVWLCALPKLTVATQSPLAQQ